MAKRLTTLFIIGSAIGTALLLPACNPECVDKFDCPKTSDGAEQTCAANKCTRGTPFVTTPDAG